MKKSAYCRWFGSTIPSNIYLCSHRLAKFLVYKAFSCWGAIYPIYNPSVSNTLSDKILSAEIFFPLKSKICQIDTNLMLKHIFLVNCMGK